MQSMTNFNDLTTLLTTAFGLIGVYVFFSLLVSWLQEYLAWGAQLRSKTLFLALQQLLGKDGASNFFGCPMIQTLGDPFATTSSSLAALLARVFNRVPGGDYAGSFLSVALPPARLASVPAYLSSRDFAANLITHAATLAQTRGAKKAFDAIGKLSPEAKQTLAQPLRMATDAATLLAAAKDAPQTLGAGELHPDAAAALSGLRALCADRPLLSEGTCLQRDMLAAIDALPPGALHDLMASRLRDADGDYQRFVSGLQTWFDDYMDRVSGWYKRCSSVLTLYLGLGVVLVLNVDSISFFESLMNNDRLAQAAASFASSLQAVEQSGHPLSSTSPPAPPAPPAAGIDMGSLAALPLGWPDGRFAARWEKDGPGLRVLDVLKKLAGLALTVAALALGAPFWFDLLGMIVNVRNAGSVPPKAATPNTAQT
ncbi:MAG: hypothetical protein ACLPYS_21110 [Vulcanimicrobiaceae bacterium]